MVPISSPRESATKEGKSHEYMVDDEPATDDTEDGGAVEERK